MPASTSRPGTARCASSNCNRPASACSPPPSSSTVTGLPPARNLETDMPGSARAAAARGIARVIQGGSLNDFLPAILANVSEPADRSLVQEMVYGRLRYAPRLAPAVTRSPPARNLEPARPGGAPAAAARGIARVIQGGSLHDFLPAILANVSEPADRSLVQEMVYGSLRYAPRLEFLISLLLERPVRKREPRIHALLMVGLYQLLYMRIPAHAAVAETVEAARLMKKPWAVGLTNAVLRRF